MHIDERTEVSTDLHEVLDEIGFATAVFCSALHDAACIVDNYPKGEVSTMTTTTTESTNGSESITKGWDYTLQITWDGEVWDGRILDAAGDEVMTTTDDSLLDVMDYMTEEIIDNEEALDIDAFEDEQDRKFGN